MSPLSREAILAVLSSLTVLGCDKTATVSPEPAGSAAPAAPSAAAAAAPAASAAPGASAAGVKEVKPAQGKGAEKEKTCSPGGCAPGQCGGSK